jgi:hypothetical protein
VTDGTENVQESIPKTPSWHELGGRIGVIPTGFVATDWFRNAVTLGAIVVAFIGLIYQNVNSEKNMNRNYNIALDNQKISKEISADKLWTEYMELGMRYPHLVEGPAYETLSKDDKTRHMWLFERLAYTAESILELGLYKDQWLRVFRTELRKHKSLLENHPKFLNEYFCDYDESMRKLISEFSDKAGARNAECNSGTSREVVR